MSFKFNIYDHMFVIVYTNFWLAYMSRSVSESEVSSLGSSSISCGSRDFNIYSITNNKYFKYY